MLFGNIAYNQQIVQIMESTQLKQLITFVLWCMEVNLNRDQNIPQDAHTPERDGARYNSTDAIDLLFGTACVESDCGYFIKQLNGPARGIFQMERTTHDDIWRNYINYRQELKTFMREELPQAAQDSKFDNLEYNLRYAIMMARLHYYRVPAPIPKSSLEMQAQYWKDYYNTPDGKGSEADYLQKWKQYA